MNERLPSCVILGEIIDPCLGRVASDKIAASRAPMRLGNASRIGGVAGFAGRASASGGQCVLKTQRKHMRLQDHSIE